MGKASTQFQIIDSPSPNEEAFFTDLDQEVLATVRAEHWPRTNDTATPTIYQDWKFALPERVKNGWGNYVYTRKQAVGEGVMRFYWMKVHTDIERLTPFEDEILWRPHYWHNVLKWVEFGEDWGFPLSQETIDVTNRKALVIAGRPVILYTWLPGMELVTKIRRRRFISDTPFPEHEMVSNEPVPTEVSFDYVGKDGGFPKCLHPEIPVPGTQSGYRSLVTAGEPKSSNQTAGNRQFFPKTNHEEWQTHTVNTAERKDGAYIRTEETFFVPRRPKLSDREQ